MESDKDISYRIPMHQKHEEQPLSDEVPVIKEKYSTEEAYRTSIVTSKAFRGLMEVRTMRKMSHKPNRLKAHVVDMDDVLHHSKLSIYSQRHLDRLVPKKPQ